jgi:hypothetical protein
VSDNQILTFLYSLCAILRNIFKNQGTFQEKLTSRIGQSHASKKGAFQIYAFLLPHPALSEGEGDR